MSVKQHNPRPPSPPRGADDKAGWHRRFTWLVSEMLSRKENEAPVTPEKAGARAREVARQEFASAYPGIALPDWMP